MKPTGDRRAQERFDVVGALWGLLDIVEPAQIKNVSQTGALIDAPFAPPIESTQTVRVIVEGEPVVVDARVRHVRRIETDIRGPRYLIGLEFLSPPESVLQSIELLSRSRES